MPYTFVNGSCHCGAKRFRAVFFTSQLPISNDFCHCNTCRHSTGQMVAYYVPICGLPLSVYADTPIELTDATIYKYDENNGIATTYFCTICSAHLLHAHKEKEDGHIQYCISAGSLERLDGIVKVDLHTYIAETKDGGLADQFRKNRDGVEMPRYSMEKGTDTIPLGWRAYENVGKELKDDDTLDFYCNCRNIHLTVTRPNEESSNLWAAYPDLLKPYDTTLLSKIRNPGDEKWWLCYPVGGKAMKYLAGHCACNNCRLTSGFPIQSWAFVPRTNVIDKHTGTIIDLRGPNRPECLRQYIFAPGKYSEFCKVCGATVFTWGNQRPGLIVISMGLVDQDKEGARAERWLDWVKERVSFSEVALTQPIIHALEQGLRESRLEDLQGKQAD